MNLTESLKNLIQQTQNVHNPISLFTYLNCDTFKLLRPFAKQKTPYFAFRAARQVTIYFILFNGKQIS